jgi:hypothetical protein
LCVSSKLFYVPLSHREEVCLPLGENISTALEDLKQSFARKLFGAIFRSKDIRNTTEHSINIHVCAEKLVTLKICKTRKKPTF